MASLSDSRHPLTRHPAVRGHTPRYQQTIVSAPVDSQVHHHALICSYLVDYSQPLVADLGDEHRALAPHENSKPPGWLLGHLAVSGDFVRRHWQRPAMTPREWGPRFAPGSQVSLAGEDYPSIDQLRALFLEVYSDLAACAPSVPDDLLDVPNPFEGASVPFPTLRDFAGYLMTAHLGYHLGQLAAWRVAAGLPPRAPIQRSVA